MQNILKRTLAALLLPVSLGIASRQIVYNTNLCGRVTINLTSAVDWDLLGDDYKTVFDVIAEQSPLHINTWYSPTRDMTMNCTDFSGSRTVLEKIQCNDATNCEDAINSVESQYTHDNACQPTLLRSEHDLNNELWSLDNQFRTYSFECSLAGILTSVTGEGTAYVITKQFIDSLVANGTEWTTDYLTGIPRGPTLGEESTGFPALSIRDFVGLEGGSLTIEGAGWVPGPVCANISTDNVLTLSGGLVFTDQIAPECNTALDNGRLVHDGVNVLTPETTSSDASFAFLYMFNYTAFYGLDSNTTDAKERVLRVIKQDDDIVLRSEDGDFTFINWILETIGLREELVRVILSPPGSRSSLVALPRLSMPQSDSLDMNRVARLSISGAKSVLDVTSQKSTTLDYLKITGTRERSEISIDIATNLRYLRYLVVEGGLTGELPCPLFGQWKEFSVRPPNDDVTLPGECEVPISCSRRMTIDISNLGIAGALPMWTTSNWCIVTFSSEFNKFTEVAPATNVQLARIKEGTEEKVFMKSNDLQGRLARAYCQKDKLYWDVEDKFNPCGLGTWEYVGIGAGIGVFVIGLIATGTALYLQFRNKKNKGNMSGRVKVTTTYELLKSTS